MTRKLLLFLVWAPLVALANPPDLGTQQKPDRDFVLAAIQVGQQEVHDTAWALKTSRMEPVRRIAQMLQQDHIATNAKLAGLAQGKSMDLPVTTASSNPTPSFSDAEFVASQIQAHEDAIALFTTEADRGADPDLRDFARQTLPTLQNHLKSLRALETP